MFCRLEQHLSTDGYTVVDNKLLINYLPDAPDAALKVYLMGLALAGDTPDNTLEAMATKLNMSKEDVMDAFLYWEELGLVAITNTPYEQVTYLEVRDSASVLKKIKPSKYGKFGKEIQNIINGRMLTVNEYNEYYMFLENTTFAPDALLAVARYCVDLKGNDINYPYILTVARNQLSKGALTKDAVMQNLSTQSKYDSDIRMLFKQLKVNRAIEHQDRELYEKWGKMGFSLDVLTYIAQQVKSGGTKRLDSLCNEYYRNGAMSQKEIEAYRNQKDALYDIATDVNKAIGVYYQSLDSVVDEYVSHWVQRGYDKETLHTVARYCFRNGIRTLQGVDSTLDKFYKLGLVTIQSIDTYLNRLLATDKLIAEVLEGASIVRNITQADRRLYNTWTSDWGLSHQLILFAAQQSVGAVNAIHYLNKVLSNYKAQGIDTVEKAQKLQDTAPTTSKQKNTADFAQHDYTDEQLSALFTNLENVEL